MGDRFEDGWSWVLASGCCLACPWGAVFLGPCSRGCLLGGFVPVSGTPWRLKERRRARREAELAGKPAPDLELEAAMAMARTTRRIGAAIGRELGLSAKTIEDWGNAESGNRGPHLTLLYLTCLALEFRPDRERVEALAAVDFVEHRLGRIVIDPARFASLDPQASQAQQAARSLVRVAELLDSVSDFESAPEQRVRAHQQLREVIGACQSLLAELGSEASAAPRRVS